MKAIIISLALAALAGVASAEEAIPAPGTKLTPTQKAALTRLIDFLKVQGITCMMTSLTQPGTSLERSVDAHIKNLRAKLKAVRPDKDPIVTHRGVGYSLDEDP